MHVLLHPYHIIVQLMLGSHPLLLCTKRVFCCPWDQGCPWGLWPYRPFGFGILYLPFKEHAALHCFCLATNLLELGSCLATNLCSNGWWSNPSKPTDLWSGLGRSNLGRDDLWTGLGRSNLGRDDLWTLACPIGIGFGWWSNLACPIGIGFGWWPLACPSP